MIVKSKENVARASQHYYYAIHFAVRGGEVVSEIYLRYLEKSLTVFCGQGVLDLFWMKKYVYNYGSVH